MLPTAVPTLTRPGVRLRPFLDTDAPLIASVAVDPLIPLITTVPASGQPDDVAAYLRRQHDRLPQGLGYSFAVAVPETDEAVGQIGLWTSHMEAERASTGYWIAKPFRGRGFARTALGCLTRWASTIDDGQAAGAVRRALERSVVAHRRGVWIRTRGSAAKLAAGRRPTT